MKHYISSLFIVSLITFTTNIYAQTDKEISDRSSILDRIYTGGNVGFQFGDITNIQVAPIIGYRVTNDFSAGLGIQYQYTKYKLFTPALSSNNYGTSVFTRYRIKSPLFLQAEYEYLNYEILTSAVESERSSLTSFFVGGGISQPINANAAFTMIVMYNLSYDATDINGVYSSPLRISGGINLGF
jgi:long-subunit fatty acid transport protein